MFLSKIHIENYRAIHKTTLSFNATTIIIGENECGKSSILEALQIILNPIYKESFPEFQLYQYHYLDNMGTIAGPIHIALTFRERSIGEWDGASYDMISFLINGLPNKIREIIVDLSVGPINDGNSNVNWRIGSIGSDRFSSDPKILYWLRHLNPTIYLSAGMLTGHGYVDVSPDDNPPLFSSLSAEVRNYVKSIIESSASIISDRSIDIGRDIEKGYNAAIGLIESVGDPNNTSEYGLGRKINEILGSRNDKETGTLAPILSGSGSTAQRLGVLLLVAAMLRAGTVELMDDMEPIWIIENPEANLHPMTLSSIRLLIHGIKWQKIVSTFSGTILNSVPLSQIRRLTRYKGIVSEHRINEKIFSREDLRRIGYHLQTQHPLASFARMWLLVEGESEFWIIPQLARLLNLDFSLEGIVCMDFAQSGMTPIIKIAQELGIEWHLLADGDTAGQDYIASAKKLIPDIDDKQRWTQLNARDIEHFFWNNGYSKVYYKHARVPQKKEGYIKPSRVIQRAVKNFSKPYLALSIVKSVAEPDSPGVPEELMEMIEYCVKLAREAPENASILQ
jgi:putative ATP-dependent endonuclease of OLD family